MKCLLDCLDLLWCNRFWWFVDFFKFRWYEVLGSFFGKCVFAGAIEGPVGRRSFRGF